MSQSIMDFLSESSGSKYPAFRFAEVGDVIAGRIAEKPRIVETKNDEGQLEPKLVLAIEAVEGSKGSVGKRTDHHPVAVGEVVSVWAKRGGLAAAINDAVSKAGADGIAEGDTLAITHTGLVDTGKMSPAKQYEAIFKPAKPRTSLAGLFADD